MYTGKVIENGCGWGKVLEHLESGGIARHPGHGSSFICMQVPSEISLEVVPKMQSLPQRVKYIFVERQDNGEAMGDIHGVDPIFYNTIRYTDQFLLVGVDNCNRGWYPSQEDRDRMDWSLLK